MACGGGCCGPKNTTTTTVKPEVRPEDLTEPPTETTSNAIATTQPNVHATLAPSDSEPTAASCSTLTNPEHAPTKPKSSCCSPSDPTKSEMSKSPCGSSKPAATPKPSTSCCSSSAPKEPKPASACCQPSDSQKSKTPESCCSSPMPAKQEVINSCCSSPDSVKPNRTSSCCSPSAFVKPKPATSCCKPPTPLKTETRAYDDDSSSSRSPSKVNPAPACAADATDDCCADDGQGVSTDTCGDSCCEPERIDCADTTPEAPKASCCTSPPKACATSGAKTSCCPPTNASKSCADKKAALINTTEIANGSDNIDVEKGDVAREHVVISVSGMTCTGCETKLQRTLGSLDYVSRLQTSLVLARVELDINTKLGTADDVVKHLHRTTEFKCEIVSNQGCSLDLICSGDPAAFVNGQWPDGVLDVRRLNKDTIRVDYDAKIVGARDLMNDEWSRSLQLAPPCPDSSLQAGSRHVRNMGLLTLLSAALTIPVLVMAWAPLPEREIAYGSASLALATIVQVVIAGPFYPKALKALVFSKVIEMDLLIVLSTSAAYIFSVVSFGYLVSGNPLSTGEFFETSTLLVTLIMVGRWVASLARQKAAESISIRSLQTPTAVLVDDDGTEKEIDARMLQYGDTFRVAPDSRIPTDGTVISGSSEIDESMLTGEAQPVEKHTRSAVIAGTINGSGTLTVRLTRLPGDNTITTIAGMVDEAKLSKPKIQEIADTVASYFVPVVVALTIITFVIWVAIGVAVRHQSGSEATIEAITYAITVLIVSCPCAIGLAVPMVIVIASGVAAKRGVVFKTAGSIEVAYRTTDVVFDKTGTLTAGKLAVVREEYVEGGNADDASLLLGLLGNVKHPVSAAIATHLASQGVPATTMPDAKVVTGKGVQGTVNGKKLRAGNARWLALSGDPRVGSMLSQGFTTFCFTIDNTLVAVFGLQDTLRLDAASTVDHLQRSCINVHVLSGDDDGAVRKIASQLNIPEDNVRSRCSPADKQAYIQSLLAAPSTAPLTGKSRKPIVMFVGDGTNDAVALAQATIGVHVSSGTDIAQSAADVVLVRPSLAGVLTIINVSRKAIHRIVFNFSWSFVYNTFAVLLGAGAFVRARIPPEFAGLGELVSVLPVVLAAVLLRWSKV